LTWRANNQEMTFEHDTMRFKLFIHEILVKLGRCPIFEDSRFWIEGGRFLLVI